MQEGESFEVLLDEKLNTYAKFLETKELPPLKEYFRLIYAAFQSIYNTLLQKGIIRTDPYKNDRKQSEVIVPTRDAFLESEKLDQISIRLSEFDSQLEHINNYYTFGLETLSLDKIKTLLDLMNYFQWTRVVENSPDINTRILAELIVKVKMGSDNFAIKIIYDNFNQINQTIGKIQVIFKKLTVYLRETYKQAIDERIMFKLKLPENNVLANSDKIVKLIKKNFPNEIPNTPFYPELVKELLLEKYSAQKTELQNAVLKRIEVEEEKQKKKEVVSYKPILLESVLAVASAGSYLEKALQKLVQNNNVLENRKKSFREKFKDWVAKVLKRKTKEKIIELEFFDEVTGAKKTLRLNFQAFVEKSFKKTRLLFSVSNKLSTSFKKLQLAEEDYILEFLSRQIGDLTVLLQKLPALDTYFKSETPKEEREKIKGIKLEITAIKNCVVRSNQKKHEYVSSQEEMEQLKKLGINVSAQ